MTFGYDTQPNHTLFQVDSFDSLSYSLNANDVTEATLSLTAGTLIPEALYNRGICMRIWRKPDGMDSYYLEGATEWIVLKVSETIQNNFTDEIRYSITAYHPNIVMRRRVVAFPAGTKFADKLSAWPVPEGSPPFRNDNYPAQLIKEYFMQNVTECVDILDPRYVPDQQFAQPVDEDRRISVQVLGDPKFGNVTESTAGYQNLLRVLQDLSAQVDENGNRVYFDLRTYLGRTNFLIRKNFLNQDKSDNVFFGFAYNNLSEVSSTNDFENEINVVYAGGSGNQLEQLITKVYPNTLSQGSENRVRNYSFEETVQGNDLPEWTKSANGIITRDTSVFYDGTASCRVQYAAPGPTSITQLNVVTGADLNIGESKTINLYLRAQIQSASSVEIEIRNSTTPSEATDVIKTLPVASSWQTIEVNRKLILTRLNSNTFSTVQISFALRSPGVFHVDSVYAIIDSLNVSPFFRSEEFVTFGDIDNVDQLAKEGSRYLNANRAKNTLRAKILNQGLFVYGREYQHGDVVSLLLNGRKYRCHIYAVSVQVNRGEENVDIFLDSQSFL